MLFIQYPLSPHLPVLSVVIIDYLSQLVDLMYVNILSYNISFGRGMKVLVLNDLQSHIISCGI